MYDLAEALIEFDERVGIWRDVHVKMVQRVIGGGAIGTQGTPVAVLAGLTTHRLYPGALGRPEHADRARGRVRAGTALTRT